MFAPPPPASTASSLRALVSVRPKSGSDRPVEREDEMQITVDGSSGPVTLRRAAGGYLQVWPRPTEESQRALYGSRFYEEDKSTYLEDMERDRAYWDAIASIRRGMIERVLAGTAAASGSDESGRAIAATIRSTRRRLLDVGASGGFLLDHFQRHGWQAFGIEPSHHAARFARERFGLEIFVGELLDFDLETDRDWRENGGRSFDAIHCAQVLEHVLDPEACVARIAELLAPDGVAFVEVPNDFNVLQQTAREKLAKPAWWVAPDHHLNYFDADSLAALLARHGLAEIDRVASFPIEMFLLMGEDYVGRPDVGRVCHARRMEFERSLIDRGRTGDLADLYRALARAGIGRTCGVLARRLD